MASATDQRTEHRRCHGRHAGADADAKPPGPEDRRSVGRLMLRGKRIASKKSVKHLIAAITRYGDRLGSQFAGAMTYFSFLSLVPILMVGFAVGGIVLRQQPGVADRTGEPGRRGAAGRSSPRRSPG